MKVTEVTPDKEGHAKAWSIPLKPQGPAEEAFLSCWVVHATWAHAFWSYYGVVPPANKKYPKAEYELVIAAIDPDTCPPDRDEFIPAYLHPIDVVEQFDGVSDRDAVRIVEAAVNAIVAGQISPDQDYRRIWRELLEGTVAHFKAGGHLEN
jgi:hypothetical protein